MYYLQNTQKEVSYIKNIRSHELVFAKKQKKVYLWIVESK
ncbi:hypothetical protein CNEO4_760089 [Clostridium neonatale]|nr:hypothetical protein CNEO3_180040 [Clostridium neonatale]CAI3592399.1 hypothetical protein CNEO3_160004 [Clostridium neonatale]CAI3594584.1 hypothetical protein CNEO3_10089 [Clostridium neonatale]CAI3680531.1 hypothetical protein CNEO3_200039 [Clostridium neonatale]CAI3704489.1 hypothetical protein CNEO4_840040 [Clostridium neonatale]